MTDEELEHDLSCAYGLAGDGVTHAMIAKAMCFKLNARVRELEEAGRALIAEWDNDQADDEGHDFRATVAHLRAALERGT
jgi:hypothetical protein